MRMRIVFFASLVAAMSYPPMHCAEVDPTRNISEPWTADERCLEHGQGGDDIEVVIMTTLAFKAPLVVQPLVNRIADCAVVLEHERGSSAKREVRRIPLTGVDGNSPSPLEELDDDLELEPAIRTHAVHGMEGVSLDGYAGLESQCSRMGRTEAAQETRVALELFGPSSVDYVELEPLAPQLPIAGGTAPPERVFSE